MRRVNVRLPGLFLLVCSSGCFFDHAGLEGGGDDPDAGQVIDAEVADQAPLNDELGPPPDAEIADAAVDAMPDACVPVPSELCNMRDDDCDGMTDEGLGLGTPCDGPDTDLCADDMRVCDLAGVGTVCGDTSGDDDMELCNGGDDDCDLAIDEGFTLGVLCDGPDGDLCNEGLTMCDGFGGLGCSDATGTTVETCNFLDDDCNGTPDDADTSSDEAHCGACFNACTNANGTTECIAGVCTPMCVGANDCDGDPDDGCELLRDTNPTCPAISGGTVRGDFMADVIMQTGSTEQYYAFTVSESAGGDLNPHARIQLSMPAGVDFDLFVLCTNCLSATGLSSTNGPGVTESIDVAALDVDMMGNTFQIRVEVRYVSSTACGDWTLTVSGNVGSTTVTCPTG